VTDFGSDLERLRERYLESLRETSKPPAEAPDAERIWDAVSGTLPAEERRRIVDRVAVDPSWAEAWRLASEVYLAAKPAAAPFWQSRRFLAAAASLALLIGAGILAREVLAPAPIYRDPGGRQIESLVSETAPIPRDAAVLRWSDPEPGARFDVTVTSETLEVVASGRDIETPEYRIPAERLADVPSGTKLYWQVTAHRPGGVTDRSRTFVTTIQ
jgi:hypothetical protein